MFSFSLNTSLKSLTKPTSISLTGVPLVIASLTAVLSSAFVLIPTQPGSNGQLPLVSFDCSLKASQS